MNSVTPSNAESANQSSTDADYANAQAAAALCREWHRLKSECNLSGNQAASALGKSPAWFSINFPRWQREGVAAFLPQRRELGETRRLFTDLPAWFLPVAKFFYLCSNLSATRGSLPEAIRRTIAIPECPPAVQRRLIKVCMNHGWQPVNGEKLPTCPAVIKEQVLSRAKARQTLLPESLSRQITVAEPFVRHHRSPKAAALDYISASGTQMWLRHPGSGEKNFIRSGDVFEADDATINFPVCIPWTMRGCPCSECYDVKVGRFQWLVAIDAGSRRVLGYAYTARPQSQYRAEDILALMRLVCKASGIPRAWRLEKGIWKSNLVINAVKAMGSGRISVHSPHCKPFIEGLFNKLWTNLSVWFPDASVGRFRGDNEEASRLLTSCQRGERDPRKYFPTLKETLDAFNNVIAEHNGNLVDSKHYGTWVPSERWNADTAARPLPPLGPETQWIFSPFAREWKVKGCSVGGMVPLFPGFSVPIRFSAAKLLEFHGAIVRAHFDPGEPQCAATICLTQPWGNHRKGEVICVAAQTDETAAYARSSLGWGNDDPKTGLTQVRAAHSSLRREVRSIVGVRQPAAPVSESIERDGTGGLASVHRGIERPSASAIEPAMPPISFTARVGKIAKLPHSIREQLNEKLRDGVGGKALVTWLNKLDETKKIIDSEFEGVPLTKQNLSLWRKGGFRDWLQAETANPKPNKSR